MLKSSN